jgi:glycosyltransferase involved in cell wall biosynthesis
MKPDVGRCLLIVVGRCADDTPEIELAAERAADRVLLLGYRKDVPRFLAAADIMALVSESEGMPSSVLEGMAAGLPVVATPVAALTRMVRHGENGFIVSVGDVDGIVDRLTALCTDRALAAGMGERSQQIVTDEYSIEAAVKNITSIYQSLVRGRQP